MSEKDEAFPGRGGGNASLAAALPTYPWLDASRCIDAEVSKTGWSELIKAMFADVDSLMRGTNADMEVLQVKEKLGSLRVYCRVRRASVDQEAAIRSLVDRASAVSLRTCIVCGSEGALRNSGGPLEVVCQLHSQNGGPGSRTWHSRAHGSTTIRCAR